MSENYTAPQNPDETFSSPLTDEEVGDLVGQLGEKPIPVDQGHLEDVKSIGDESKKKPRPEYGIHPEKPIPLDPKDLEKPN